MPTHCSAFGCTNSSGKESCKKGGVSFHKFPLADKILLGRWLVNVRRANFEPTPYSFLCSDHFTEEDFEYQPFTKRRGLKKGAVPTKFTYKIGHKRKQSISYKSRNHEMHGEDNSSQPAFIGSEKESNKIHMDNPALLEIVMNEKFYPPEHLEALAHGLPKPSRVMKPKSSRALDDRLTALKESLHAEILLRSSKKQLLDAEIKAANAKRDYYEAKKSMLFQVHSEDSSDSETDSPLKKVKSRLEEEEAAAEIEERMLQEQLKEARMQAAHYERESKSRVASFNWQHE